MNTLEPLSGRPQPIRVARGKRFRPLFLLLCLAFPGPSALSAEVRYSFSVVARTGASVAGQTLLQVARPAVSSVSLAYAARSQSLGDFVVQDGRIAAKRGDLVGGQLLSGALEPALDGAILAYTGRSDALGEFVVKGTSILARAGDQVGGERLQGALLPAFAGAEIAYSALAEDSRLFVVLNGAAAAGRNSPVSGRIAVEAAGAALSGEGLAFAARDESLDLMVVRNGIVAAAPAQVVDGETLEAAFEPALSRFSLAYTGSSAALGEFVVIDNTIVAKKGDSIDGLPISSAYQPAISDDASQLAFIFQYPAGTALALGQGIFRSYFGQVGEGGGFSTVFKLVNLRETLVQCTLRFYAQNGSPRTLVIDGVSDSEFNVTIPGNGTLFLGTSGSGPAPESGWALLDSDGPVSGVASYQFRPGVQLETVVSVLGTDPQRRVLIPVETGNDRDTGMAIANVSEMGIRVRLHLINDTGTEIATREPPQLNPLPKNGHVADFVTQFFPEVSGGTSFKGSLEIEITGEGKMAFTALQLQEGILSNIPIIELE